MRLVQGDCVEVLAGLDAESIDAVVTDPPYGIGFMGHAWDQPGEYGPVRSMGNPGTFASGRPAEGPHVAGGTAALERQMSRSSRRATQRDPSTGAGHERERQSRKNTQGAGGKRQGARFAGPTGTRHTGDDGASGAGGAMHAGRYDLSPTANGRFQAWCQAWGAECLRVLKPGGHLVAFGGTRTYHRLVAGLEDAGFEIRDQLAWLFGSGFPKSLNLDGEWLGWGTALKPGHEPIVLARKPLVGTVTGNVLAHGTGALHIGACRIPTSDSLGGGAETATTRAQKGNEGWERPWMDDPAAREAHAARVRENVQRAEVLGRWPSNVILDPEAGELLDDQAGDLRSGANPTRRGSDKTREVYGAFACEEECEPARGADAGGASRFFYCAKTSSAERNAGLDGFPVAAAPLTVTPTSTLQRGRSGGELVDDRPAGSPVARNDHPTVKPIDLMRWLVRLITPPGGTVLDPFTGSGTTGCAAALEGAQFVGVERDAHYLELASARMAWWSQHGAGVDTDQALRAGQERDDVARGGQASIFDDLDAA